MNTQGRIAEILTNEQLMKIPVKDNGEKLVNLAEYSDSFVIEIEETSKKMQALEKGVCFSRESVGKMLAKAQELLPKGYRFKIVDAYRPMSAQKEVYMQVFDDFKKLHKDWSDAQLESETDKWVANPKVIPPHTTGGALDLTIIDDKNLELDMGTQINTSDAKAYTLSEDLKDSAKKNREILINAMIGVGFVNNPREWWHWSYGDRRWAATMKTSAIYGSV